MRHPVLRASALTPGRRPRRARRSPGERRPPPSPGPAPRPPWSPSAGTAHRLRDLQRQQRRHQRDRDRRQPPARVRAHRTVASLGRRARPGRRDRRGLRDSAACAGVAGRGLRGRRGRGRPVPHPGRDVVADRRDGSTSVTSRSCDSTLLQGLDQQVQTALQPVLDQVVGALQGGLQSGLRQLGDPGLFVGLGAVESRCTAAPGTADGSATPRRRGRLRPGRRPAGRPAVTPGPPRSEHQDQRPASATWRPPWRTPCAASSPPRSPVRSARSARPSTRPPCSTPCSPTSVASSRPSTRTCCRGTLNRQVRRRRLDRGHRPRPGRAPGRCRLRTAAAVGPAGPLHLRSRRQGRPRGPVLGRPRSATPRQRKQVVPRRVTAGLAHGDEHTPLVLTLGGLLVLAAGAGALDFRRHLSRGRRG